MAETVQKSYGATKDCRRRAQEAGKGAACGEGGNGGSRTSDRVGGRTARVKASRHGKSMVVRFQ